MLVKVDMRERQRADAGKGRYDRGNVKMLVKVDMRERQRADAGKGRYEREAPSRCW
jgi:hypothetical protein